MGRYTGAFASRKQHTLAGNCHILPAHSARLRFSNLPPPELHTFLLLHSSHVLRICNSPRRQPWEPRRRAPLKEWLGDGLLIVVSRGEESIALWQTRRYSKTKDISNPAFFQVSRGRVGGAHD